MVNWRFVGGLEFVVCCRLQVVEVCREEGDVLFAKAAVNGSR